MNILANTVVTLTFKLFDASNKLIEESPEPLTYLHGGHSGIFPKIEEALNTKTTGDSISVTLEPEDAFGEYDAKMIRIEPLADLPPDVTIGGYLVAEQDGREVVWRVTGVADGKAVLDGNHELAGQRLRFDGTVLEVRAATADEVAHGHAHGAGGHHHH
ncbi:MAG: peptidylprolyl isomerase [Casimicrobiaceae bacterium]